MGNATWICFDCREAVRRPTHHRGIVSCPQCRGATLCLGTKIRIPRKADRRAWQDLRVSVCERRLAAAGRTERMLVRRHHCLERKIAGLEARPANAGRTRAIYVLRKQQATSRHDHGDGVCPGAD